MEHLHLIKRNETVCVIIDAQDKLHRVIPDSHEVMRNVAILASGMRELGAPVVVTEQYPKGVGPTCPEIKAVLGDAPIIEKREFSCYANESFQKLMAPYANKTLVLCGFEAHVCVLQTAIQARSRGHRVAIVTDAVSSRSRPNKEAALERLRAAGCCMVTTEMILFELLETSTDPAFKAISQLIK